MIQTTNKLIDGKTIARTVLEEAGAKVEKIKTATAVTPSLATILVGDDPASATYVRMKHKRCESVGMTSLRVELSAQATTQELLAKIEELARDDAVHGILLQHPTPPQIDERAAFDAIPLKKDVDGVTSRGLGRVMLGESGFPSCTPAGIMRLLRAYDVPTQGEEAVVIGRSAILGTPMAAMLLNAHATVTICHSYTVGLPQIVRRAQIVVVAVGHPKFLQGDWLKEGAVVIDAGYNPGNVGDVDFDSALPRASLITPVPGGVGPMTIATLINQTADAAARQLGVEL